MRIARFLPWIAIAGCSGGSCGSSSPAGTDGAIATSIVDASIASPTPSRDAALALTPIIPEFEEPELRPSDAGVCMRDDGTGVKYAKSALANDLSAAEMREEIDSLNVACGDIWCEGSFEMYFAGLTCNRKAASCDVDLRYYSKIRVPEFTNVTGVEAKGDGYHGAVLAQHEHAKCTPPCWKPGDGLSPRCGAIDVRCSVQWDADAGGMIGVSMWSKMSDCISGVEDGIRAKLPEFAPRKKLDAGR